MISIVEENKDQAIDKKKRGRKKFEGNTIVKGIGLFDHIKHIRSIQDPDYFKTLSELDIKSFNHFMILKALSMNPSILEEVSELLKYFDKIPSPQFYLLLIKLVPLDKKFYPWVKGKPQLISNELLNLLTTYYQVSSREAIDYANLLFSTDTGRKELENLCCDNGFEDSEIKTMLALKETSL